MIYETFNPKKHDIQKVAELVYDVDFRTYDMLFKDKSKAIKAITGNLAKHKTNPFFKIISDSSQNIIGFVSMYNSKSRYHFHLKHFKLYIVDVLDYFVICDIKDDDLYIAEIAVDESVRCKGVGSRIINDVIDYASSKNYKRVTLDADFRNVNAKKLYGRIGFKTFNKKQVKIGNFKRGMYNMELIL